MSDRYTRRRGFANLLTREEPLPTRIAQLPRGVYFAVQRTIENAWFGKSMPLEQACEQIRIDYDEHVNEEDVKSALVEFINLLVRAITFTVPLDQWFPWFSVEGQTLGDRLTRGLAELTDLKRQLVTLECQLEPLRREVSQKRDELSTYEKRMKRLRETEQKLTELIRADRDGRISLREDQVS